MTESGINRWWYGPGGRRWAWLLAPLAALFALVSALRRLAYRRGWLRSESASVPVIVVGNLSVGGTGKTPVTIWLARELAARGRRVGIVSRGHGGRQREAAILPGDADPGQYGDEPALLALQTGCPVAVGARRAQAAALLARECGVEVILSDDGLQHYALRRDLEIAVIDGERGLGNGWLLPAGPLREGPWRLREVDAVILRDPVAGGAPGVPAMLHSKSGVPIVARLEARALRPLRGATHGLTDLAAWRGRRVHAIAGIGAPQRFFAALRAAGLEVIAHAGADHANWSPTDLAFGDELPVLMTAKDAVKCQRFAQPHWYCVEAELRIEGAAAGRLLTQVLARIAG